MRLAPVALSFSLLAALACGGGADAPDPAASAASTTASTAAAPAASSTAGASRAPAAADPKGVAAIGSPADAALADRWLVILASDRDPAKPPPVTSTIRDGVERKVQRLNSGRFKNLMPCYAITIADALPERAAALAFSKQLKAQGVDNYVKNAGSWVGPSAAVDAWCGAGDDAGTGAVASLVVAGGRFWMPVEAPAEVVANAVAGVKGAPVPLSDDYDAWRHAYSVDTIGTVTKGASYRALDAATGRALTCTVRTLTALTVGTPHFGALEGGPLKGPACGEPGFYAELECDAPAIDGTWVAAPATTALGGYAPVGPGTEAQKVAAQAALTAGTDWDADVADLPGEQVTRDVHVTRWKGPGGEVALVEGLREAGNGVCGGDAQSWATVFPVDGKGLGAALAPFVNTPFGDAVGLLDTDGDGRPELVTRSFPTTVTVTALDGTLVTEASPAFCDCGC